VGVITISREFGSGGETVARLVAEKSAFLLINKKIIVEGLAAFGVVEPDLVSDEKFDPQTGQEKRREYIDALHNFIYDLAIRNDLVILGRGGDVLFQDYPPALHVKIISSFDRRLERVMKQYKISSATAHKLVKEQDMHKKNYYRQVFNINWANLRRFDLVLNTAEIAYEDAAEMILAAYRIHGEPKHLSDGAVVEEQETALFPGVNEDKFMHPSEAKFARMLDFYQIKWEYEPKTFLLEWDSEGNVLEAFSPDFYLPEQNLFIELTTQKARLGWKKNRKIRRLKELYPEVKIKLINRQGFASLLHKQGPDQES
jgi:cytidylate kinase